MSPEEINDLRKSLANLGFEDEEINTLIEKAKPEESTEDSGAENVKEMAEEGKENKESDESNDTEKEYSEEEMREMAEEYEKINARKAEIEKCMGGKLKKSIGEDIHPGMDSDDIRKSIEADIQKSISEKVDDIRKSIMDDLKNDTNDIIKSISDKFNSEIANIKIDVEKIANTPIPMKSVFSKVNFFEKSIGSLDDDMHGEMELSISKDKDLIVKGLQNELEKENDPEIKTMLSQGISDITISASPNSHGRKAIAYLSKKNNITILP